MDNLFDKPAFVSRPASEARARREQFDGSFSKRKDLIMSILLGSSLKGSTWKEIADMTSEHHGQVSSALSNMHRDGFVFQLRQQRDKCHPYLHHSCRIHFQDSEVYDSPAQTKAGVRRIAHLQFVTDVQQALSKAENNAEIYGSAFDTFMTEVSVALSELHDKQSET